MEAKQIIAIIAVLAIACAGIGAAYAYQAELTDEANTVESNYLELNNAGQFTGHFSNADLQWDMVNSQKDKGYYTPAGTLVPVAGDLMGIKVITTSQQLTDLEIAINSSSLPAGNWFKFNVEPVQAANHSVAVDLNASYALKFTYQKAAAVENPSTPAEVYIDYIILDAADSGDHPSKQTLFYSDKIAGYGQQTVKIEMYAIPTIEVANPNTGLDFTLVDFIFTAEAFSNNATMPETAQITVVAKDMAGTEIAIGTEEGNLNPNAVALRTAGARIANTISEGKIKAISGLDYTAGTASYFAGSTETHVTDTWTSAVQETTVTMTKKLTQLTITPKDGATAEQTAMKFSKAAVTPAEVLAYIIGDGTNTGVFDFKYWSGQTATDIVYNDTKLTVQFDNAETFPTAWTDIARGMHTLTYTYTAAENGQTATATLMIYLAD